jgi:hypothetical protein
MKIQCVLHRTGGTVVDLGGKQYHFEPLADGTHVAEVDDNAHIDRFLAISDGYRLYRGSESPKCAPKDISKIVAAQGIEGEKKAKAPILVGSDDHKPQYEINGNIYSIGEVVRMSFEKSGLTSDEWNELDTEERAAKIDITLDEIAEGATVAQSEDREALAARYESKFGKRPHYRLSIDKIKVELGV